MELNFEVVFECAPENWLISNKPRFHRVPKNVSPKKALICCGEIFKNQKILIHRWFLPNFYPIFSIYVFIIAKIWSQASLATIPRAEEDPQNNEIESSDLEKL